MKKVMEKSLNMKNWPKVMEFCDQSWNFTNFNPELYQMCMSFATTKKLSIDVESLIFQRVFCKMKQMQNREERWKSWKNIMSSLWEP